MPVATRLSAAARMSLSVTLPAKKFQLFQPMGGVAAVTGADLGAGLGACCAAAGAVGLETNAAQARSARERRAEVRMMETFPDEECIGLKFMESEWGENDFRRNSKRAMQSEAMLVSGVGGHASQ